MPRPHPTTVVHFTHVSHLASIVRRGLLADSSAHDVGLLSVEVGNVGIKAQRQRQLVPIPPGGAVADYVPFYFAPRSPMMYAIERGNVSSYSGGCDELVYLVTTVETLVGLRRPTLFTDRNAALTLASFSEDVTCLDTLIDWPLMRAKYWADTEEDRSRRERRMAECLVHERVPWAAFSGIVCRNTACAATARRALASVEHTVEVAVRPGWYF